MENTKQFENILQIKEVPELVYAKCLPCENLFLSAVFWNRFPVAQALREMGADIHWTCEASMFNGNARNVAHTPQQADQLLEWGVEIEQFPLLSECGDEIELDRKAELEDIISRLPD